MPIVARYLFALFAFVASLSASAEAPYFRVRGAPPGVDALPLKSTAVKASLGLGFAETTVIQTYRNEGTTELEATYLFPAGEGAAVHGVTMTVGDRRIEAVIKEKAEARQTYEKAKSEGKSAALLEEQRPNVFSLRVARIQPGDTISVELRYTERVGPVAGEFSWAFPTTIGPRYDAAPTAGAAASPLATNATEPVFSLEVDLRPGFQVERIFSPSHTIRAEPIPDGALVHLVPGDGPVANRDFVLRYHLKGDATKPRLLVQEWLGQRYVAVNWMPPARNKEAPAIPRDFVFVVDVSGSMAGFPLETAQQLVSELLQELREGDTFNVLLFSGSNETLSPTPLPATPENLARGIAFLRAAPGGGGTELLPALEEALASTAQPGRARTFVVVTDGYVTVEAEAYALVAKSVGNAALFPFGIGTSVNRDLIQRLARAGKTQAAVIEGPERAVERAAAFRAQIDSPVLADTHLTWNGTGALRPLPATSPAYADQPWTFVARLEGDAKGSLVFTGVSETGAFRHELNLNDAVELPSGPLLAQCWARDQLERLTDLLALEVDVVATKQAIIQIGLGYHLLTPFTSFVAVDTVVRSATAPGQTVAQPNLAPASMSTAAMGEQIPSAPEPSTWALLTLSTGFLGRWWLRRRKVGQSP